MLADRVSAGISRFSSEINWESLPEAVRVITRREVLDLFGGMVAGRGLLGEPGFLRAVRVWGGRGVCRVVDGSRASPAVAAMLNGYWSHALELDDTHDRAVLHAGASVIPAAMAAAGLAGGCSGVRFLEAVVVGIEVMCRLGVATRLSLVESGWIYSALLGHFGAAAAASRVLSGTVEATGRALGAAYVLTGGNHQSTREGSETKHMQPGIAGSHGVLAALMAAEGLPAVMAPFLGEDGLSRVYLRDGLDADAVLEGLGVRFETERLSFKPYPSCRLTHPAVTAALELRRRLGEGWREVRGLTLRIGAQACDVVGRRTAARMRPGRRLDAQFSVFWAVAVAFRTGGVVATDLVSEVPPTAETVAWIDRIACVVEAAPGGIREVGGCVLVAEMADGGRVEVSVASSKGHVDDPMSEGELVEKFLRSMAAGGRGAREAERLALRLLGMEGEADVLAVFDDLVGTPAMERAA